MPEYVISLFSFFLFSSFSPLPLLRRTAMSTQAGRRKREIGRSAKRSGFAHAYDTLSVIRSRGRSSYFYESLTHGSTSGEHVTPRVTFTIRSFVRFGDDEYDDPTTATRNALLSRDDWSSSLPFLSAPPDSPDSPPLGAYTNTHACVIAWKRNDGTEEDRDDQSTTTTFVRSNPSHPSEIGRRKAECDGKRRSSSMSLGRTRLRAAFVRSLE